MYCVKEKSIPYEYFGKKCCWQRKFSILIYLILYMLQNTAQKSLIFTFISKSISWVPIITIK